MTAPLMLCTISGYGFGRWKHPYANDRPSQGLSLHMAATFVPTLAERDRVWHVIDANSHVLGRVATVAATLLIGKHKPRYTPFLDLGDHVIIVNAQHVKLTGRKENQKLYRHHSGYQGGLREQRAVTVRAQKPTRLVEQAVRGMLPKTKLGNAMYRKLKVYSGPDHPHAAQKPTKHEVS